MTRKKISQWIRILHYILDYYVNFQCPGIIESILECGLLLTMPDLDYVCSEGGLRGRNLFIKYIKLIKSFLKSFWAILKLF